MTDKVYVVSVMLSARELKQPNNGYRLENIENIINQLLVPPYKATIEDDMKSRLLMDGMLNFYLNIAIPETLPTKFLSYFIVGSFDLNEDIENQLEIVGNLVNTCLYGKYITQSNTNAFEQIAILPDVSVSFKKV
jgi:hypothetical protein